MALELTRARTCELQAYRVVSDSSGFRASAILVFQSRYLDGSGSVVRSTDTICIGHNAGQFVGQVAGVVQSVLVPVMDGEESLHVARSRAKSGDAGPMVATARVKYVNGVPEMTGSMETARPPIQLMRNGLCCCIAHGPGGAHVSQKCRGSGGRKQAHVRSDIAWKHRRHCCGSLCPREDQRGKDIERCGRMRVSSGIGSQQTWVESWFFSRGAILLAS